MRHLDPQSLPQSRRNSPKRKFSNVLWALLFAGAVLGGGRLATQFWGLPAPDDLTQAEIQKRRTEFETGGPIAMTFIDPAHADQAVASMRLPQADAYALLGRLHNPSENLRLASITLWDTHSEDGDVVAVISAGYRIQVALQHAPRMVTIPVHSEHDPLQIMGLVDGGGGITLGLQGTRQPLMMPILLPGQSLILR